MPGFFDAVAKLRQEKKVHCVTIQGKTIEVGLDQKLEINKNGLENYTVGDDGKTVVKKIRSNSRNRFPELEEINCDPFWPDRRMSWKR
jgi:hypothetical protein